MIINVLCNVVWGNFGVEDDINQKLGIIYKHNTCHKEKIRKQDNMLNTTWELCIDSTNEIGYSEVEWLAFIKEIALIIAKSSSN